MTEEQIKQSAREKRIAELEEQNTNLQIMLKAEREVRCNEDYLKTVTDLEAQIEKMRNCANCKNYNGNEGFCVLGSGYGYNCNLEKWEIKEK